MQASSQESIFTAKFRRKIKQKNDRSGQARPYDGIKRTVKNRTPEESAEIAMRIKLMLRSVSYDTLIGLREGIA